MSKVSNILLLGMTEKFPSDCDSDQTLGFILTFCKQVLVLKILAEFGNGQNHLNRFKIAAILNI